MAKNVPSMDAWLAEAKKDESAAKVGMYLVHNGVVREDAKAKVRGGEEGTKPVTGMFFSSDEEKIKMCEIVSASGADYIKTSTGFSTGGATKEDVALFAAHVADHVKIKAAGGISSIQDAEDFINLGASRLGTSRIVKLVKAESVPEGTY